MKGFVVSNLANFFNRNSLIVIDDLERHSTSLSIRDILGVLTQLKEEKGCQIIIVMNEDVLQKDGADAPYFEIKEKVIDREILFQPTIEDAITIGLRDRERNQAAVDGCRKLAIANIRTIQKIDSTLRQLRDVADGLKVTVPESFDLQLQTTTVLATWSYWERVIEIDDLEKLELGDSTQLLMDTEVKLTNKQKDLYQRVREYGYTYSDETDRMIIRFVKTGVIDSAEMGFRVGENDAAVEKRRLDEAMEHAWAVYRGTLQPNINEVVNALYESHVQGIQVVQTASLGQAVWVLRELGEDNKADDLTERFFTRTTPIDSYSGYPFKEMLQDQRFVERWKETTDQEVLDDRNLETTIQSYYSDKRNAIDDIKRLSQFTADQFYDWFKNTGNPNVVAVASALARIQYRLPTLVAETEKIEADVRTALRRIYGENKLNQIRLRSLFLNEPSV
jgi:hypothetical protein